MNDQDEYLKSCTQYIFVTLFVYCPFLLAAFLIEPDSDVLRIKARMILICTKDSTVSLQSNLLGYQVVMCVV